MNKQQLQLEEEIDDSQKKATFSDVRKIARMAIFIALSAVGALVKIPSPTGTVALDACPGYFSGITFGAKEGGVVAFLGHLLTAAITGYPLGIITHVYIGLQMAVWVAVFYYLSKKINIVVGAVCAILCNGIVSPLLIIPIGGKGLALALMLPLTVGSAVNVIIAAVSHVIVKKSNLVEV